MDGETERNVTISPGLGQRSGGGAQVWMQSYWKDCTSLSFSLQKYSNRSSSGTRVSFCV